MPGTKEGGAKAAARNKELYGDDFYKKIGSIGGKKAVRETRAFFQDRELARIAGAKGGRVSKRRKRTVSA